MSAAQSTLRMAVELESRERVNIVWRQIPARLFSLLARFLEQQATQKTLNEATKIPPSCSPRRLPTTNDIIKFTSSCNSNFAIAEKICKYFRAFFSAHLGLHLSSSAEVKSQPRLFASRQPAKS